MKPLRLLTIFCLSVVSLFALTATPASADARGDCPDVDTAVTATNTAAQRAAVICLTNRERISRGLGALKSQPILTDVAQRHSEDMAEHNYFAHVDLSGGEPWDRAEKAGYKDGYVGENIAAGRDTPFEVMAGWMASSGHCSNIMSAKYVDIGIGVTNDAGSEYGTYWTMVLGGNDPKAAKVTVRCPFSDLVAGSVPGAGSALTGNSVKAKITSAKRRSDGRYRVQGKITPVSKGTVVKLTVRRGTKIRKYSVKTSRLGTFVKTVSAPGGAGKVMVSAKV